MAKFLKFRPRDYNQLRKDGHFRPRVIAECVECSKVFSSKNVFSLAADLDMHGWKYYKDKELDVEGPMCPDCQDNINS